MRTGERGFGYVFLLVLIAVLGAVSAFAWEEGRLSSRRDAEQELIHIGRTFEEALGSYSGVRPPDALSGPNSGVMMANGPAQLEDLLRDPRVPGIRRHLRKLYPDPLTGTSEWGLVRNHGGRIVGIHSLSSATPIKKTGFEARHAHFGEAKTYQDWHFGLPAVEHLQPKQ
jgi:hypothetical protein